MSAPELPEQLRRLRLQGRVAQARDLIRAQPEFATSRPLQRLLHEHEDFWWKPIEGRRVTLRRRGAEDTAFVRACWADEDFMRKFNRLARPLVRRILSRLADFSYDGSECARRELATRLPLVAFSPAPSSGSG